MIKISIITINLNNVEGLERTLNSVINQTVKKFEYIVIDGGSSDKSLLMLEQCKNQIDKLIIEPDNGIYHAMNKGIKLSTGEYIIFLNSGDVFVNNSVIESVLSLLQDSEIIFGDLIWRDGLITNYPHILDFSFLRNRSLPHQATFIKLDLFYKHGYYDEDNRITSDWKFFLLCICKYNVSYKKIPFVISKMESGGISDSKLSNTGKRIINEKCDFLNSEFKSFLRDYELLARIKALIAPLTIKFWKRYFSKYRKSSAVSAYDW